MQQDLSTVNIERTFTLNSINKIGGLLQKIGLSPFGLRAAKIIAKAKKSANYTTEVPPQLQLGLEQLIESINKEANTNTFGSLAIKGLLERTVYNRLKVEQVLQQDKTIEQQPIQRPIFIIGMPRTGTTILHALLHEDPANRSPLAWECLVPYPIPRPETFTTNTQLKTVQKELQQLFQLVPDFQKKHFMAADMPQECLGINALDCNSFQTSAQVYIPSYMEWFSNKADKLETMRFHKRFLQYLQSGGVVADRWLLKSPVHLLRLEEIFEVYPDACIVMTHRHPSKVVPSAASLVSSVRSLYSDAEDAKRTGAEQSAVWSDYFNRFLDARKKLGKEDQIIDLKFDDFVKDQVGTVQKIYDYFGFQLSDTATKNMKAFLAQNPKDKHGAHQYTLHDFGLTETGIEQQFSRYINFLEQLK
jgi:hypothetical protein